MDVRRVPKLRIEFAKDGQSITITDAAGDEHSIPCRLNDNLAAEYRIALRETLNQVKNLLRKQDLTAEDASLALDILNHKGLSLVWQIFGDQREQIVRIFQGCLPTWRSAELNGRSQTTWPHSKLRPGGSPDSQRSFGENSQTSASARIWFCKMTRSYPCDALSIAGFAE